MKIIHFGSVLKFKSSAIINPYKILTKLYYSEEKNIRNIKD